MTDMIPAAVPLFLAKATVVLLAALGLTRALQRASAGARHVVWLAALGALLLVPVLAAWGPLRLPVLPPPHAAAAVAPREIDAAPMPAPAAAPSAIVPAAPAPMATPEPTSMVDAVRRVGGLVPLMLAVWAAVALAIAASVARAWLVMRGIVRRARPLDEPAWMAPLWEVADRLDLEEAPRLLCSGETRMPFACGLRRPTIVLPTDSDAWTADRRRAVLLHELAHVRRRDLAGHTLARLVCAAYWFHPLVWTAARRLRAESERACDDLALAAGARPADYAEHLLDIVASVRRDTTPLVALAMARRSEFEGRMLDILDPERPRGAPGRRLSASLVGGLAVVTVVVSAAAPAPAPAPAAPVPSTAIADASPVRAPLAPYTTARPQPRARRLRVPLPAPAPTIDVPTVRRDPDTIRVALSTDGRVALALDALALDTGTLTALAHRRAAADERTEVLARVLRTDTSASLRRVAAWGLAAHAGDPGAATALAAALHDDASVGVREMAAWGLAEAGAGATARDALSAAARADADAGVRFSAVWALGSLGDARSADVLTAALRDASAEVRTAAVWALGTVRPSQAPSALVAMLGDRDARVRRLTAWALFTIADPATAPALQSAMRAESDPALRVADVRALAALGDGAVDALRDLIESRDTTIRGAAIRALAGGRASAPWPWPWPRPRPYP
ncbi:MAG: HEAT repeat domain-containing protein [Gemmatirosa sp.]|nr:HEAT repeat domain-containing protein [Gemmatirosa sp.]